MNRESVKNALQTIVNGEPPVGEMIRTIDVGTGSFLSFFEEETIGSLIFRGGATCKFFEGVYGSGKTHLVHLFREMALSKKMLVSQIDLSSAMTLQDWPSITTHILGNVETLLEGEKVRSLPSILQFLGSRGLVDTKELKTIQFPHPGFGNAIRMMIMGDDLRENQRELLQRFLLGEKIGAMRMREVGIRGVKNPLSKRNAELVLRTVFSCLFRLGKCTMLLIDETERVLQRGASSRIQMAGNLMRRIIDACHSGTITGAVIVFTALPGFISECAKRYEALGERLLPPAHNGKEPGWRWPVLQLDKISDLSDPQEFMEECILKFENIVRSANKNAIGLKGYLSQAGKDVLKHNAGMGFRRDLVRRFASICLDKLK